MSTKIKDFTDQEFNGVLEALAKMNTSQVDRLWEAVRLEMRQRFYNQGLEGAVKAVEKLVAPGGVALLGTTVIDAIRAKTWKTSKVKVRKTPARKTATKAAG